MSACAAQGDRQAVFTLLDVAGDQAADDLHQAVDKFLRNVMFEHILRDLFIVAGQILETRHIIGVGNEAYVEHPVGLDRDPVLVAERHEIENKRIPLLW